MQTLMSQDQPNQLGYPKLWRILLCNYYWYCYQIHQHARMNQKKALIECTNNMCKHYGVTKTTSTQ